MARALIFRRRDSFCAPSYPRCEKTGRKGSESLFGARGFSCAWSSRCTKT